MRLHRHISHVTGLDSAGAVICRSQQTPSLGSPIPAYRYRPTSCAILVQGSTRHILELPALHGDMPRDRGQDIASPLVQL